MKIAVLGANGKTGRLLVDQALAAGHEVVAYVRRPAAVTPRPGVSPGMSVVGGELDDPLTMTTALEGAGAVVSCLGPRLRPWDLVREQDLMTTATASLTIAMRAAGVPRVVVLSALGVGDSAGRTGAFARFVYGTFVRTVYADKLAAERALAATELDWVVVYPAVLTNGTTRQPARVVPLDELAPVPGLPRVSRTDVAATLLRAATGAWSRTTVAVIS